MAKRKSVTAKMDPTTAEAAAEESQPSKKRDSRESTSDFDEKPNIRIKIDGGSEEEDAVRFLGEPVPHEEAQNRWPHRYQKSRTVCCCLFFLIIFFKYMLLNVLYVYDWYRILSLR